MPNLRAERHFSVKDAEASDELLNCIEDGDIQYLHRLLSGIPGGVTSILNTPSLLVKHKMRTPLMAAAATGDLAKFTATLHAFDRQFLNKVNTPQNSRHYCVVFSCSMFRFRSNSTVGEIDSTRGHSIPHTLVIRWIQNFISGKRCHASWQARPFKFVAKDSPPRLSNLAYVAWLKATH